jgi:hypothetical protein
MALAPDALPRDGMRRIMGAPGGGAEEEGLSKAEGVGKARYFSTNATIFATLLPLREKVAERSEVG